MVKMVFLVTYNKSFISQASSFMITRYWPCSFFLLLSLFLGGGGGCEGITSLEHAKLETWLVFS